jgi:hypothetical protein
MTAPTVGLAEAARITGTSESTIRRKREELQALGATRSPKGSWSIPVPALVELGLLDRTTPPAETPSSSPTVRPVRASTAPPSQTPTEDMTAPLRAELEALRKEAQEFRERALVAEAVLRVKDELIQTQASALRMLEGSQNHTQVSQPAPAEPTPVSEPERQQEDAHSTAAPRKKWWRREK